MSSSKIMGDIHKIKNDLSSTQYELSEMITEYRDTVVAEGVQEVLQVIKEGDVTERDLRLIIGDVVRKCVQV